MYVSALLQCSSEECKVVDVISGDIELKGALRVCVTVTTLAIRGNQLLVCTEHCLRQLGVKLERLRDFFASFVVESLIERERLLIINY